MVKVGVVIPSRGDRPRFLTNCLRMIREQTLQPHIIQVVDFPPLSESCDITQRYRIGYEVLRGKELDVIALIEDDDFYSEKYLENMVAWWNEAEKPDLFGLNHTIYYNIKLFAWFKMNHTQRSSAMNTLIKPDLDFKWCDDHEAFTDIHLWNTLKGVIVEPKETVCIGIKHGMGKCGGKCHVDRLHRYINIDLNKAFIAQTMDHESFKFYSNYFK
jgi:hypothetical protein